MTSFFRLYQLSFEARPYTTLICANATLSALGDTLAQNTQITLATQNSKLQVPSPSYDFLRTARFAIFGAAMGPVIGRWVKFLDQQFPLRSADGKASLAAVGKRVASDQIAMAPLGLLAFIGAMGIMERRKSKEIKQKYTDLYISSLLANWTVWPFAQMVNFRFIPLAYRVPFQASCGVFWTFYLSLMNASENKRIDEQML